MSGVRTEQKSYEMPRRDGFTVTHFITVADIDRSADFYEKVFGGRILSRGDSKGASGHIQIANTWLIVNVGGGSTPDKPSVTLSVPADPHKVSSFLNIRVADIRACYELWKSRGAVCPSSPVPAAWPPSTRRNVAVWAPFLSEVKRTRYAISATASPSVSILSS